MQVTIYGVQEPVIGKCVVKVFHEGKEILEIPKQQQVTLDVPDGDFLEFRLKKLSTEIDVIGKHIILSWQSRTDSLYAFVTNSPERILTRLRKANKKGLLMSLLDTIGQLFNEKDETGECPLEIQGAFASLNKYLSLNVSLLSAFASSCENLFQIALRVA